VHITPRKTCSAAQLLWGNNRLIFSRRSTEFVEGYSNIVIVSRCT